MGFNTHIYQALSSFSHGRDAIAMHELVNSAEVKVREISLIAAIIGFVLH